MPFKPGQIANPGGTWKPGQSGNPGGRPKALVSVVTLARTHTREAIQTLKKIISDKNASASARVSAATVLLDRGWGKPFQSISLQHEDGRQISDGELLAILGSEDEPPPAETEH
jgi:Family of unknown function (DUF5681)